MGIRLFGNSDCSCYHDSNNVTTTVVTKVKEVLVRDDRNPDPKNFKVAVAYSNGKYTAAKINYPNCTNYEGNKILVLKCVPNALYTACELDPHFCEHQHLKPIARFEPTDFGWTLACRLVDNLN